MHRCMAFKDPLVLTFKINPIKAEVADPCLDLIETFVTVVNFAKGTGCQEKWQKLHFDKFLN